MAESPFADLLASDPDLIEQQAKQQAAEPEKPAESAEPEQAAEPLAEGETPPELEIEVEEEEEEVIPKSRLDEVLQQRNEWKEKYDELMRLSLQGFSHIEKERGESKPPEDEVDPDVAALVNPILEKRLKEELRPYEDLRAERERERQIEALEKMEPGIKDIWPQIEQEFRKLPSEMQPQFDNQAGVLYLAQKVRAQQQNEVLKKGDEMSKLSKRAYAEGGATATRKEPAITPEMIMNASPEEFEKIVRKMQGRSSDSDDYMHPLIK